MLHDLAARMMEMRDLLQTVNFNGDDRNTVEANLKAIEMETKKDKPRRPLIESSLKSIESLVKNTESIGSYAAKLAPVISKAIEMARQLIP